MPALMSWVLAQCIEPTMLQALVCAAACTCPMAEAVSQAKGQSDIPMTKAVDLQFCRGWLLCFNLYDADVRWCKDISFSQGEGACIMGPRFL